MLSAVLGSPETSWTFETVYIVCPKHPSVSTPANVIEYNPRFYPTPTEYKTLKVLRSLWLFKKILPLLTSRCDQKTSGH
jgi:hypothetical protein